MFTNILLKMLKQDLMLQIMKSIPLPSGNNRVIRLMKDELGEKIMTEIIDLTSKKYKCLVDDGDENKNN